jgi:hypothetical protein
MNCGLSFGVGTSMIFTTAFRPSLDSTSIRPVSANLVSAKRTALRPMPNGSPASSPTRFGQSVGAVLERFLKTINPTAKAEPPRASARVNHDQGKCEGK